MPLEVNYHSLVKKRHVNKCLDDGATFIDDAPDTPAPVFVVRAFKTAIFGTPKPIEYQNAQMKSSNLTEDDEGGPVKLKRKSEDPDRQSKNASSQCEIKAQESLAVRDAIVRNGNDQFASPTKGILLTPGTAATRRKTVSFSASKDLGQHATMSNNPVEFDSNVAVNGSPESKRASEAPRKQSALTKTLIELSTKRSSPPVASMEIAELAIRDNGIGKDENLNNQTIDLSQPFSRSGQHWKAEYDEYHKNSTREMRKIIQYGQNVKSYAAKKDCEATILNEKLQKELAKVTRMEAKVSRMAKQLRMATVQNPQGDSEQARLVGELAQQTAMTVRYQKKAEQYRKRIRQLPSDVEIGNQTSVLDEISPQDHGQPQDGFHVTSMEAELRNLQEVAATAEKKAVRLEDENKRLKRSLARVKEEMITYDSKRQAKEERLKRREERHKASKETCEAELVKLKNDYNLLQVSIAQGKGSDPARSYPVSTEMENLTTQQDEKQISNANYQIEERQYSSSPRKRRPQKRVVDIWTTEDEEFAHEQPFQSQKFDAFKPSKEGHDTHRALSEIPFNPPASNPQSKPLETKLAQTQVQGENIRPVTKSFAKQGIAEDPINMPYLRQRLLESTMGKSASLLGSRVGSRTSTMGTARTCSLSAERQAAAKARLAERKKSGEKKRVQTEVYAGSLR